MLKLVRQVRQWAGPCYLMANRGFGLLPRLGGTINGVLIEALSTTWVDGYRTYERHELDYTAALVARQGNAPEFGTVDTRNPVVIGEPVVQEGEFRVDEVQNAAVLAHHRFEEQLCFALHGTL